MNEEIIKLLDENIEALYNSLMEKPLQILEVFNDFFGEDKVDMQGYKSLEEFKEWILDSPIYIYSSALNIKMSAEDWNKYSNSKIMDIPEDYIRNLACSLKYTSTIDKVGEEIFSYIFILVHFPHVRVTNEHDRFVDINHLWAKVKVMYNGALNGGFTLNRSEYTMLHISSGYMH